MGLQMLCCVPSRFCSKALSQKVKLPFAWNDAIHLCQSAKLSTQAAPLKLIPCFASAEFAQIQEDGCGCSSGCSSPARFNVAIPADFTMHEAPRLYLLPNSQTKGNRYENRSGENKINLLVDFQRPCMFTGSRVRTA